MLVAQLERDGRHRHVGFQQQGVGTLHPLLLGKLRHRHAEQVAEAVLQLGAVDAHLPAQLLHVGQGGEVADEDVARLFDGGDVGRRQPRLPEAPVLDQAFERQQQRFLRKRGNAGAAQAVDRLRGDGVDHRADRLGEGQLPVEKRAADGIVMVDIVEEAQVEEIRQPARVAGDGDEVLVTLSGDAVDDHLVGRHHQDAGAVVDDLGHRRSVGAALDGDVEVIVEANAAAVAHLVVAILVEGAIGDQDGAVGRPHEAQPSLALALG